MTAQSGVPTSLPVPAASVGSAPAPITTDPVSHLNPNTGPQLEPGQPRLFDLGTHCGAGFLSSSFNGRWWRTADAHDEREWMPAEWVSRTSTPGFEVELLLSEDGDTLTVTYNGHAVVYTPTELRTSDICA